LIYGCCGLRARERLSPMGLVRANPPQKSPQSVEGRNRVAWGWGLSSSPGQPRNRATAGEGVGDPPDGDRVPSAPVFGPRRPSATRGRAHRETRARIQGRCPSPRPSAKTTRASESFTSYSDEAANLSRGASDREDHRLVYSGPMRSARRYCQMLWIRRD
jgi:hypothetical protein